ncbi:MAG: hypothetical protein U0930_25965 [Pirellulales bacterium]
MSSQFVAYGEVDKARNGKLATRQAIQNLEKITSAVIPPTPVTPTAEHQRLSKQLSLD